MTVSGYERYAAWKSWSSAGFARYDAADAAYYTGELRGAPLAGANVLELGFGNGGFLGFASDKGAKVAGTELIPEAVRLAEGAGVRVYRPDLSDAVEECPGTFDVVVAFDVLEHLTRDEIRRLFDRLEILLRPGGVILARFPNGASPLGCISQNADLTHKEPLSAPLVMQLLLGKPWRLLSAGNPYRVNVGSPARRLGLAIRHALRDMIEAGFNRLYGVRVTLDPNVIMRIERTRS